VRYTYLGDTFGDNANAVGYIPDDNRQEIDSAMTKTFWMKTWGLDRIEYKALYDIYWGMDKTLRSWDVQQGLTFDLRNKLSFGFRYAEEYKLFEKDFRNHSSTMQVGYNTDSGALCLWRISGEETSIRTSTWSLNGETET